MTDPVSVTCLHGADGWRCEVKVGDDPGATQHEVLVDSDALAHFAPPGATPDDLVRESFGFLLEREPRSAIMRSFELPVITRFYADYEAEIRRRMRTQPQ